MAKKNKKSDTFKVGRDAGTGRFIPVKDAERRKKTAVVETIKKSDHEYSPTPGRIHKSAGVSGSAIIRDLKIKQSAIKEARKLTQGKRKKKKA